MALGVWVLADQLNTEQAALASTTAASARVLLVESTSVLAKRVYHRQRLVLAWSAMRHFAEDLRQQGWQVDHLETDSFRAALNQWIAAHGVTTLRVMEPADRDVRKAIQAMGLPVAVQWLPSNAFLWSRRQFEAWASRQKQHRLELFYREGRKRFGVLLEGEGAAAKPLGGQWNYDQDNRKPPPKGLKGPKPLWFEPDGLTRAVIAKVQNLDQSRQAQGEPPLPGSLEPFGWAVSRRQALDVLEAFICDRLAGFGPYQDAMVAGEPTLWHALLSPYLNLGLLHPGEVIDRIEARGLETQVPLQGLEGVIRQILGWREYTHGLYHWFGPDYALQNHFSAELPLPAWMEQLQPSGMGCLDTVIGELHSNGYAHHIQRLMVLANYALLMGLNPQATTDWFHRMFIDGYDWVMQTNVLGMGLHADGGRLASKPYAASGNYIRRMSNYCQGCRYDPKLRVGPTACPFNGLYWDFLDRHEQSLSRNPRMTLVIKQLQKLSPDERISIRAAAQAHRDATSSALA